jgi:hypothetical protein
MEKPNNRSLATYFTLISVSAILLSLGILWLNILGCALISLSDSFSVRRCVRKSWTFINLAVIAISLLAIELYDGKALRQERRSLIYWVVIAAVWLWLFVIECSRFRRIQNTYLTHDDKLAR